jgi:hypothetical protein
MSAVSIAWTKIRSINVLKFKLLSWSVYSISTDLFIKLDGSSEQFRSLEFPH